MFRSLGGIVIAVGWGKLHHGRDIELYSVGKFDQLVNLDYQTARRKVTDVYAKSPRDKHIIRVGRVGYEKESAKVIHICNKW